jgi:hypothetical protein
MQTDGAMQLRNDDPNAIPCEGAIDSDGGYVCGQLDSFSYSRTMGQIALVNGQPASMSGTSETTAAVPGFECDFQLSFDGTYLGP